MATDHVQFHIPTKPYSLVDAINRCAAATGSVGYAMATADSDYNGHRLGLYWNDYRRYYVCDYHWGERIVITRNEDFAQALAASKREFARQGRGASLIISARPEDAHVAQADADLTPGAGMGTPAFWDWKFWEVGMAVKFNRVHHLLAARNPDHYRDLWYGKVNA